ncbi:MAG TPA: ROK family glucokinase [Micromonosporaceae bacterium]|nr:ROK family glucokinase [Micromonosporaceae bacterium]
MSLTIGVDIGGTKVLAGVVHENGEVVAQARRDTPATSPADTLDRIVEVVDELVAKHEVTAVGIGAAGWIDASRSTVLYAPNLAWRNEPLRDEVAKRTKLRVVVENDANVAAWAEFQFGAAKDADDSMVMFTIGTGIGGGVVLGGQLVRGAHGIAAELGHVLAVPDGHPCGCGSRGCLEQYASGKALTRFAQEAIERDSVAGARLLQEAGGDVTKVTGVMVTEAAQDGDLLALGAFENAGTWLGRGLSDLAQILDPQVIVVGGGVIEAGDLLLAPARRAYVERLAQRANLPVAPIVAAAMGNTAGVVGAADLARR